MPGDIAEMMLGGLMCEGCGEIMEDMEEPGFPRRCPACGGGSESGRPRPKRQAPKAEGPKELTDAQRERRRQKRRRNRANRLRRARQGDTGSNG